MSLRLSGGRRLLSPPGSGARPTAARVRLAVMNLLAADIPGCRWLDLCSGSGVMACEALQRGASEVVAVERDRRIAAVARANLELIQAGMTEGTAEGSTLAETMSGPRVMLVADDVMRWLNRDAGLGKRRRPGNGVTGTNRDFDLIYADPPYRGNLYEGIAEGVSRGGWLRPGGTMVWECSSSDPPSVPQGWRLIDERRYGGTGLILLEATLDFQGRQDGDIEAGCR